MKRQLNGGREEVGGGGGARRLGTEEGGAEGHVGR